MTLPRCYCENIEPYCSIEGKEAHHLINVRRLVSGDCVEVFDGKGSAACAEVVSCSKKTLNLKINEVDFTEPRRCKRIILAVSLAKAQRFDWLIAKASELGVDHICPIIYQRTVKQAAGKNISARYSNIAVSAAKQCGRRYLPAIEKPCQLPKFFDLLSDNYPKSRLLVAAVTEENVSLSGDFWAESDADVVLFIGPEGGFTDEEQQFLNEKGAENVKLTDTVLRIETAAVAASAILSVSRDGR